MHVAGTRFGIGVDPADGLLRQGKEGYQLTWMDAKVGNWVVTPRRGKAVEINALWYNALRLLEQWLREEEGDDAAKPIADRADQTRDSFSRRFWNDSTGYLFDVLDGSDGTNDPALRPNQIFAIALEHAVLDRGRWLLVLRVVKDKLLTPVGLRTLAPGHSDYKAKYFGDLRSRDAAYHQGTVWAWLLAHRPVHRCVVAGEPRGSRRSREDARRVPPTHERGVHRIDQRDLRRRAAVHAAGLYRSGLERRGSAALPREDRTSRLSITDPEG